MTDALTAYPPTRIAVADPAELAPLREIVRKGGGDKATLYRLTELAVDWVLANPDPVPLTANRPALSASNERRL
jgi:hypothetical protein